MKSFTPIRAVLFFALILGLFAACIFFIPEGKFKLAGMEVRFMSIEKLVHGKIVKEKDITDIISNVDTLTVVEDPKIKHDNLQGSTDGPQKGSEITTSATNIHLSEAGEANLNQFFEKLDAAFSNSKKIRIIHYGDSQIEGDRMTNYIRQRFQEKWGGNGVGMIPAASVYETMSYNQKYSPNFQRYTCFGGSKLSSKRYGYMNSAARFTPELNDTAQIARLTKVQEAWMEISPGSGSYSRARTYSNVNLYYSSCFKPCEVNVYQNGNLIHQDSLKDDGKFHVMPLSFPSTPGKLRFEFKSTYSPNIIGYALEGDYGVQVDNIAMRGSSGTFFGQIDQAQAAQMYQYNQTELVIMQFGGNSVPGLRDSSSVHNYVNYFKGQLQTIKRLRPNAMILVIGPSDMSKYVEGEYQTYPLLPALVAKMKKATMEVGGGYWDLYSAMGGQNSMQAWVAKGLAGKDYIHFSNRGANIMAQYFYEAFAVAYSKWKNK